VRRRYGGHAPRECSNVRRQPSQADQHSDPVQKRRHTIRAAASYIHLSSWCGIEPPARLAPSHGDDVVSAGAYCMGTVCAGDIATCRFLRSRRRRVNCQWPSVSPQLRPSFVPTGGHESPHRQGLATASVQGPHPFAGGRLREPVAVLAVCDTPRSTRARDRARRRSQGGEAVTLKLSDLPTERFDLCRRAPCGC
jgi:hypothetical protein